MPLREIEERFTKSDLAIVGWRSQETSYLMDKKMKHGNAAVGPGEEAHEHFNDPNLPTGLPGKFFDKQTGELDLRGVTGEDALKFLRMQGVNVPFVPYNAQKRSQEEGDA
jgi:hypothetical protein